MCVNVNLPLSTTIYFTQMNDGSVRLDCSIFSPNCEVIASFDARRYLNIEQAWDLYTQLTELSNPEQV